MTSSFSWKDVSDERLAELAKDFSASEIGKRLGCSRNAVIGRCSRRKIALCGNPAPRTEWKPVNRQTYAEKRAKLAVVEPVVIFVEHLRLTLTQLRHDSCRWPLWKEDAEPADKRYCGVKAPAGQPYCDHCRRLSYEPKKRDAANPRPFRFARAA